MKAKFFIDMASSGVGSFFYYLFFGLGIIFLLAITAGLYLLAAVVDPKSKFRIGLAKYSKLAVEFLKLGVDALRAIGLLVTAVSLISMVYIVDHKHAFRS
jgi:hypothetical protein